MQTEIEYNPHLIENIAQQYWEEHQSFKAIEDHTREKFYCLSMFPYPSGRLHIGHVRNYTIGDVITRYQRMLGKNVLQPMGWDAFGLPAENAAIQHGIPPSQWTYANIKNMKSQLKQLGFGYDWERELKTCDPNYYHWEQWLFIKLFEKGLAYRAKSIVNWDPVDQTVLANEQVIDGRGWRSGALIEKREIEQWFVAITHYAQELLDALPNLTGWPERVRTMQRNWIGRSEGVLIKFNLNKLNNNETLEVYTTRPDTLMGVTYLAIAAEHPLANQIGKDNSQLHDFIKECHQGGISEAELETIEKKGCPLGIQAIHPVTGETIPIFAANFVLMGYGTGAVMAVPAHDQRDWEFAERYGIAKRAVIHSSDGSPCGIEQSAYTEPGILFNSGLFDGLTSEQAHDAIANWLAAREKGARTVHFRLRDWGVSRQRYWGCPIPIIYQADGKIKPATDLPIKLPEDLHVDGMKSPLKQLPEFFALSNGDTRETDTFDTFFESSWYYARYCSFNCIDSMLDERANYWLPVDQYIGGIEHAVLHLLYARFFHKLLRDEGLVSSDEPFINLLTQGMVVAETWYRIDVAGRKQWFNPAEVTVERDAQSKICAATLKSDGQPVLFGGLEKMSKSKNNGVDPQGLIERYGADTVRLYIIFTAPPEQSLEWSADGVAGAFRFLKRLWGLTINTATEIRSAVVIAATWCESELNARREIHSTLKKALFDYERQQFNTVVSAGMSIVNILYKLEISSNRANILKEGIEIVLRLLAPIIPHITHYLWRELEFGADILNAPWPKVDETALQQEQIEYVVQINGKMRANIQVPITADQAIVKTTALEHAQVQKFLDGRTVQKVIFVPKKLINLVINQ